MWPFRVDGRTVGEIDPPRALALARFPDVFAIGAGDVRFAPHLTDAASRTAAAAMVARALADEGRLSPWRGERYAVGSQPDGTPLFLLERAAARYFGIRTFAVHVNGSMRRDGDAAMWIARRSPHKAIDPGLLDNLVGGGIAAGATVAETLAKEAWEEAGLPAALARTARPAGTLEIRRAQPDGLQVETIFVHDLELPNDTVPTNQDGEVAAFRDCLARRGSAACRERIRSGCGHRRREPGDRRLAGAARPRTPRHGRVAGARLPAAWRAAGRGTGTSNVRGRDSVGIHRSLRVRRRPRRQHRPPPNRPMAMPPARPRCTLGANSRVRVNLRGPSLRSHPYAYRAGPRLPGSRRYAQARPLTRIYEFFPLMCTRCGAEMRIIAFITDNPTVRAILGHRGEPIAPPTVAPARGPRLRGPPASATTRARSSPLPPEPGTRPDRPAPPTWSCAVESPLRTLDPP